MRCHWPILSAAASITMKANCAISVPRLSQAESPPQHEDVAGFQGQIDAPRCCDASTAAPSSDFDFSRFQQGAIAQTIHNCDYRSGMPKRPLGRTMRIIAISR